MHRRGTLFILLVIFFSSAATAQLAGYSSLSFGYHNNPLYNYARLSDQLKMGYLELAYQRDGESGSSEIRYVGGLATFSQLRERDYYEHGLGGFMTWHFTATGEDTSSSDEEETEEEAEHSPSYADSTGSYLTIGGRVAARHDRAVHQDFDNRGVGFNLAYRFETGAQSYARLQSNFAYRVYPTVGELSNWNNILTVEIAGWSESGTVYGASASAGIKYYTLSVFDTTKFQSSTGGTPGKGKGSGNSGGTVTEQIFLQPKINGTLQLSAGIFFRKAWSERSSFRAIASYRITPRYAERYLAPLTPEASLTEDLYSDFFSSKGPELQLQLMHPLFSGIEATVNVDLKSKMFGIPALDLDGVELGPQRTDLWGSVELTLTRSISLVKDLGVDVTVGFELARNQSNDLYNDFSMSSVTLGIGVGF